MRALRFLTPLLALTACAATPAEPPAKPALWQVADSDTTIYLFGSVHLLPADLKWRTRKFDDAVKKSSELVMEIPLEGTAEKQAAVLKALAYTPGLPPLAERVPPEKRAELAALIAKSGAAPAALDRLETWAAAIMLGSASLNELDVSTAAGVERTLGTSFKSAGKPISALESVEQQLRIFDSLPEAAQRRFLIAVIDSGKTIGHEFAGMLKAWSSGDIAKIAASFDTELRQSPELAGPLIHRRNAAWADWVKARLDRPGTIMIAVGAGHLAGAQSVPALLEAQGIKVRRVQ